MGRDLRDSSLYEARYRFKERRSNRRFFAVLVCLVLFFLGIRYYWTANYGGVKVFGNSMNQTLVTGQQLVMRYTDGSDAKRGDVIVIHIEDYPDVQAYNREQERLGKEKTSFLIKRLIAVEGDVVECKDGEVWITYAGEEKATLLPEPYAYYRSEMDKAGYDFGPYKVGEGEIFFLGDNRNNSTDSRYKENGSHLKNSLYKAKDIIGIVPAWAIENRAFLEKIFF